jgi:hypothetical protein
MPNITYLLDKLNNATPTYGNVLSPRCLTIDNHGYLVTISQTQPNSSIVRFDSTNMTLIDNTTFVFGSSLTIKYYNNNYYVGVPYGVLVIDSNNLTIHYNLTSSNLNGARDVMFLNNGDILVVASINNNYLLFFNRSNNMSTNYNFGYGQPVNYSRPHGLFYINDTYFYATSYTDSSVYSYSAISGSSQWSENLVLDARPVSGPSSGPHIAIDECGRFWFSLNNYDLKIFDSQGSFLGNFTFTNASIFHTIITDNYVMYLSDTNSSRIIRIDPDIQC